VLQPRNEEIETKTLVEFGDQFELHSLCLNKIHPLINGYTHAMQVNMHNEHDKGCGRKFKEKVTLTYLKATNMGCSRKKIIVRYTVY